MFTKINNECQGNVKVKDEVMASVWKTDTKAAIAKASGVGVLSGDYRWGIVFVDGRRMEDGSIYCDLFYASELAEANHLSSNKVTIDKIPVGPPTCKCRAIYRTTANDINGIKKFVGVIWDNVTPAYIGNLPDAALGSDTPNSNSIRATYGAEIPANMPIITDAEG
jgi:hypothetical protein